MYRHSNDGRRYRFFFTANADVPRAFPFFSKTRVERQRSREFRAAKARIAVEYNALVDTFRHL
jgi:hypothetical protein